MEGSFVLCGAYVMEEDGGFSDPRDVLVEGGIIRAITSSGRLPRDAARYDCRGLWLIPGVFDCHAHVGMSIDDAWENHNTPYSLRVLQTAGNLRTMLHSGVTFVRDAGGTDAGVRAALAQGEIEGPDLQVSVNLLCQTGGHMDGYLRGADLSASTEGFMPPAPGRPPFLVDGPEEMRRAVRQVIRAGS